MMLLDGNERKKDEFVQRMSYISAKPMRAFFIGKKTTDSIKQRKYIGNIPGALKNTNLPSRMPKHNPGSGITKPNKGDIHIQNTTSPSKEGTSDKILSSDAGEIAILKMRGSFFANNPLNMRN